MYTFVWYVLVSTSFSLGAFIKACHVMFRMEVIHVKLSKYSLIVGGNNPPQKVSN